MEQSLNVKFVFMRANAEMKAAQSNYLGVEHAFLGLLKLAELTAEEMFNAPDFIKKEADLDIQEVQKIFIDNDIDTTRTRGHLRYIISGGAAANDVLLDKCLKRAEEICTSEHQGRMTAKSLLTAIIENPSDLILQVCPIERKEALAPEVDEMSLAFLPDLTNRIRHMRAKLLSTVFGQDHVVHAFAEGMFAAEVLAASDEKRVRPRAIFVFAGPPGVGKTFLAEQAALALALPFKRFDMTSYADHQSYMGLIGFEKSYHEAKKGTLTGFVRSNPHCILLFDEIEKAHVNTINLFLQILDAGRLNDRFLDEDISFKDAIIIFTTNAGSSLYDGSARENTAGISRNIILGALNTEINPSTGRQYFPQAITSRMATGWPLLFNHLQAHHLEKISSGELSKLCVLFEKQYGIKVKYDNAVPTSLLLQEGGMADARTLRAQTELFFKNEIFKVCRLWGEDHFTSALNRIEGISIISQMHGLPENVSDLFNDKGKPEMLVYAPQALAEEFKKNHPQYIVYTTQNVDEALSIAGEKDIRLALINLTARSVTTSSYPLLQKPYYSLETRTLSIQETANFDYSPITDSAISDGNRLFKNLRERLPDIPLYLLETTDFAIDPELELSFIRAGARGKLKIQNSDFSVIDDELASICRELYIQKVASRLANERKIVSFETVPRLRSSGKEIEIRLGNYTIKRAVSAEDSGSVLDDIEKPDIKFSDVIGAQQAKDELQFFIEYMKNPKRFSAQGLKPPKGILLYGPPGTGKTMLAKAMAGECDVAFIPAVASSFVTKWQGSGSESVRSLFQKARRYAPSIIFIDEIDAIGRKRGQSNSGHGEEMALNALLAEMDGFSVDPKRPVFVLAATNFEVDEGKSGMGVIDPALSRRFDCKVLVDLPNEDEREAFLRMALSKIKVHSVTDEMIRRIASRSVGVSPSWLASVMEMANRIAIKSNTALDDNALDEAYETVVHGSQKEWGREYLERVARHEAGHALMNYLSGNTPVYLTIVARGDHGGYMEHSAEESGPLMTKRELLNRIRTALGGRAAELVYYGEEEGLSTGASGDLRSATRIATAMIQSYGMDSDYGLFVGETDPANNSEVREKIRSILASELDKAKESITANRSRMDRLVSQLLKKNKLTANEIEACLQ